MKILNRYLKFCALSSHLYIRKRQVTLILCRLGERGKEENLIEFSSFMCSGTFNTTYLCGKWNLHRFCRSKKALWMSSVVTDILVNPKQFNCIFSVGSSYHYKSKFATVFLRNLMSKLYPSFSSICPNQFVQPKSILYWDWFIRSISSLLYKSAFTCNNTAVYIHFELFVCIVTVISLFMPISHCKQRRLNNLWNTWCDAVLFVKLCNS